MAAIERLLAPVPAATFAQAGVAAAQKWAAEYNVACWVRGRPSVPVAMTLLIRYRDNAGVRQVTVDRAECRQEAGMLLAGRVSIPATGPVEEMTVWLSCEPTCESFVDELYVQRIGAAAVAKPIVAAR
jgi:hypothetical protein